MWIIAHKLREINTGTLDEYLGCKLGTIVALFMTFLISGTILLPL
jgi:hypothetical protein